MLPQHLHFPQYITGLEDPARQSLRATQIDLAVARRQPRLPGFVRAGPLRSPVLAVELLGEIVIDLAVEKDAGGPLESGVVLVGFGGWVAVPGHAGVDGPRESGVGGRIVVIVVVVARGARCR